MPELDGFGVLRAVRDVRVPGVVFVTAFGEHAVRDEEATDYLVKPFDDDRFGRALDRARVRIAVVRKESAPEPGPNRWLERFAVDSCSSGCAESPRPGSCVSSNGQTATGG